MKRDSQSPSLDRIREILDSLQGLPVLVLGDVMLDIYLSGRVERISPESPVPVVVVESREQRLGGAANVARNIAALGGRPRLLALRGEDATGLELVACLEKRGISAEDLVCDPERPTSVKTRILGAGQQICRYDSELRKSATGSVLAELERRAMASLEEVKAVVLSDYGKGVLVDGLVEKVVAAARERGVPVVVDPKEGHFSAYRGVDLVTPNKVEAGASYGLPIRSDEDLETVGAGLQERLGLGALMITLGEDGIALFEGEGPSRRFPAKARQVFDVTGAGDTVVATLALSLAAGASLDEGAALANHAAAIVVGEIGTAAVKPVELLAGFLDEYLPQAEPGEDGLILDRQGAAEWAERARSQGKKIVFTNGCFDILHFGHHALLSGAAAEGDLLVIGLNSDRSVKELKGPSRPVNPEAQRSGLLAHLRSVDAVCIFDEATPLELIKALRPDVLVKGDEYAESEVVGGAEVKSWGGRVHRFPMQQGYSTTLMMEKEKRARGSET
jgi:D-beta-D-heptose 7-phosphate kinase / D-beta-D-heptose 1-phosphate adenosyltransferase